MMLAKAMRYTIFNTGKDKEASQGLSLMCRQKTIVYPNKETFQFQTRCYLLLSIYCSACSLDTEEHKQNAIIDVDI